MLLDMEDMLGTAGFDVVGLAVSKSSALELINSNEFDIVTLDYNLAGETSEEIAEVLNEKNIPFVLVSGKVDVLKNRPIFRNHPAMQKPVSEQVLIKTVRDLAFG